MFFVPQLGFNNKIFVYYQNNNLLQDVTDDEMCCVYFSVIGAVKAASDCT